MKLPVVLLITGALLSMAHSYILLAGRRRSVSWTLNESKQRGGDPLRQATGIRPSLHPLTINILTEALKIRARNDTLITLQVQYAESPLQVAVAAGKIASDAIRKRQDASKQDDMSLTVSEQQTVAGRVVGVVMRLNELEAALWTKCCSSGWVSKYDEWSIFGVLKEDGTCTTFPHVQARIASDPLFAMNRAECLLALFLNQIEAPELARKNVTVLDNSKVDFLDSERSQVLLGE